MKARVPVGSPAISFLDRDGRGDDKRPLVVFCAATSWDGVTLSDRHLAVHLSRFARILWVDPPISPLTRAARRHGAARFPRPRLRTAGPGITRLTPAALPALSRPGVRMTTPLLVRSQIRWALRRMEPDAEPHAVVSCSFDGLLGGWSTGVRRVMYGTDDFVAGARLMGLKVRALIRAERRQLARSDTVVAVSPTLQDRWSSMGARPVLIPNGVLSDAYSRVDAAEPADDVELPPPIAGVIGHLSERIDLTLLEAVVGAGCSLLLVGPVDPAWEPERFGILCRHERVRWVGKKSFADLPRYLRLMDVGLIPYQDSAFNRASFPLKTLEYLAAGRAVVSTDLPAVRWLETDMVRIASDPAAFAAAARAAIQESHVAELVSARREFAARHSWFDRAAEFAQAIGLPTDPAET